ncbi:hypothetical protein ACFPRL_34300 [Pseudoclavibacter helvolus]
MGAPGEQQGEESCCDGRGGGEVRGLDAHFCVLSGRLVVGCQRSDCQTSRGCPASPQTLGRFSGAAPVAPTPTIESPARTLPRPGTSTLVPSSLRVAPYGNCRSVCVPSLLRSQQPVGLSSRVPSRRVVSEVLCCSAAVRSTVLPTVVACIGGSEGQSS